MFTTVVTSFLLSLLGLIVLFVLKYIEFSNRMIYGSIWRRKADEWALLLKALLHAAIGRLEQLPHDFVIFLRMVVHLGAIVVARGARAAERGAHKIADRVSHKHHFERGETQSAFLKSVSEHKNGLETRR